VLLFPANPEECFYQAIQAFDLAERLQTPVMVLSDLDIGMNDWMCPELKWDDAFRPDRGKMLSLEEVLKLDRFFRFRDVDEDGITYRTLPGMHPKAAYFTRGSGHTQYGGYTEDSTEYQLVLDRLKRKFATAAQYMPKAVIEQRGPFEVAIVAVGSSDGAVREALDILQARGHLRRRAESRRAAALVADDRDRRREIEAAFDPALQRIVHFLRVHRERRDGRGR
jgi:2-oxoglutarate ferredoxin oxidoreductase subunit alpha